MRTLQSAVTERALLRDEHVIGLGESYWQGAIDKRLAAYASSGAVSCHEAISTEDVLSRVELGYYVMIREGYIRRDLEIIFPLKEQIDTRRLILVTGGTDPELLLEKGYLVDVVQKDVDLGLNPVKLVQMVSLNPAEPLAPK